ncbi:hypothetical protein NEDG_02052 [Nematocida displodere]|uniref:Mediator complex subunit 15 KIX domain-containing protein n=1 Tax=Nematocida displodere TaxID=1805483 RepID=A0A177ELF2_9MICR|nr:hypothetical protein NEDG_02052 [Nematocida displodere]
MKMEKAPASPEERKAILRKMFQALRQSPMFSHYTIEHIRDSAIKSEQLTYDRSRSRQEYMQAMQAKLFKIEKSYVMNTEEIMREIGQKAYKQKPVQIGVEGESAFAPRPGAAAFKESARESESEPEQFQARPRKQGPEFIPLSPSGQGGGLNFSFVSEEPRKPSELASLPLHAIGPISPISTPQSLHAIQAHHKPGSKRQMKHGGHATAHMSSLGLQHGAMGSAMSNIANISSAHLVSELGAGRPHPGQTQHPGRAPVDLGVLSGSLGSSLRPEAFHDLGAPGPGLGMGMGTMAGLSTISGIGSAGRVPGEGPGGSGLDEMGQAMHLGPSLQRIGGTAGSTNTAARLNSNRIFAQLERAPKAASKHLGKGAPGVEEREREREREGGGFQDEDLPPRKRAAAIKEAAVSEDDEILYAQKEAQKMRGVVEVHQKLFPRWAGQRKAFLDLEQMLQEKISKRTELEPETIKGILQLMKRQIIAITAEIKQTEGLSFKKRLARISTAFLHKRQQVPEYLFIAADTTEHPEH